MTNIESDKELRESLLLLIKRTDFKVKAVARACDVSTGFLSRVLHGKEVMSEDVRKKLLVVKQELQGLKFLAGAA